MSEYKERKKCPFTFNNPVTVQNKCLEDDCMAWIPAIPEDKMKGDSWNALVEYIEIERVLPHDIAENFCRDEAKGHCKLIKGRS